MDSSDDPNRDNRKTFIAALAGIVVVVLVAGIFFVRWYIGYRDWNNHKAATLFSDIEPADGATVYASDAWVHWTSPVAAKGRVLWRKSGGFRIATADTGSGEELLAHLDSLTAGAKYEYMVEESDGIQTLRSAIRTLKVESGIAFDPVIDQTVDRDYDQTVKLTLRNRGSQPVVISAKALKHYDDLPSDIAGYGSVDVPATIPPNGTQDVRLAITAADATGDTYEIPVEAGGAYVSANFHVRRPKFDLAFRVLSEDPKNLAKMVEIQNNGEMLTDLSVRAARENDADLILEPSINHLQIYPHEGVRFSVSPVLYLEFESLNANIDAYAAGQSARFGLGFKAPPGVHLISFRSGSVGDTSGLGGYCTNNPNTCSLVPGPPGNGSGQGSMPPGAAVVASPPLRLHEGPVFVGAAAHSLWPPEKFQEPPVAFETPSGSAWNLLVEVLAAEKSSLSKPAGCKPPCKQLSPDDPTIFGLSQNNSVFSPYGNWRVYPKSGDPCKTGVHSVDITKYVFNPQCDAVPTPDEPNPRPHPGDDMSSQDASGNDTPLPFTSPISGIVEYDPSSGFNTITIFACCPKDPPEVCRKGFALQFLHSSEVYVKNGQRVSPGTVLGATGGAGAGGTSVQSSEYHVQVPPYWDGGRTHLHVQVRDPQGILQDPKVATGPFADPPPCDCLPMKSPPASSASRGPYRGPGPLKQEATDYGKRMAAYAQREKDYWLVQCWNEGEASDPHSEPKVISGCLKQSDFKTWDSVGNSAGKLANDPPDSSYQHLAVAASNSVAGYLDALAASMERCIGAKRVGDRNWTSRHAAAMRQYLKALAVVLRRNADGLQKKAEQLPDSPSEQTRDDRAQQRGLQQLRQTGLKVDDLRAVTAAGISEDAVRGTMYRVLAYPQVAVSGKLSRDSFGFTDLDPLPALGARAMLLEEAKENRKFASDAERIAVLPMDLDLRTGLLSALQRRGMFTRMHHGRFAAQFGGDGIDSSDFPESWHTGDQIYFAWHQNNDQVILGTFDHKGELAADPEVLGNGRWPRIVASGNGLAVGWDSSDPNTFTARIYIGKHWGSEIHLNAREVALNCAPDGTLYAAGSTGLWKLAGDHFDRVEEASYSQPAIAVDNGGKPHVAWRQNGHILYDGSEVGTGERPSIIFAGHGTPYLAYLANGAIVVRTLSGDQWSAPDTVPAKNPSWPTLALDDKGAVRLSYIGPADFGPDATWLVRLPDKQSIMLPSLDGNVTDAWFSTTFNLNQARNHFRRHDLLLSVNDVWIKMFQNTVPEGRYLFHLNPNQVFTSPGKPVPNRISIHSWHMNPGHYSSNTGYELGVRMSWSEHYVFAANEEDAKRSVTSEHVNHDQPDLGLFANAADLPIDMPKPGRINIPILIANLGEAPSLLTRLVMYRGEGTTQQLASVPVPAIKQGEEKTVVMPLDYDGKMPSIYFRLEDNKDFDPSNDELNLVLWEPLPTAYDGPDPNFPKVPLELKVTVGGQPAYQYDALDAFTNRVIAKIENGEQRGALRTGAYHVAVKPYGSEGQQTLFTDEIDHQAGVTQQVDFKSGIKIEPADVASKISRWSAARADNPGTTAQWQSGSHSFMALAPGEYLVELQSADTGSSTVWPQRIQVLPGQQTTLSINSGLRLAVAPELVSTLNRWQLVPFGNPSQVIQDLSRDTLTGIVPPGEYLIKSVGHGTYNWITWPQKIQVQPGQQATFAINSSLRLDVPADVINTLNRWQVVRFGNASEVIEDLDRDHRTTILPPGEYQIKSVGHGTYNWITWPQKIQVQPGQQATFAINSSLRLDVPADVINTLNRWQVVRFGNASEVIEDLDRDHRTTILPPGDYQIISLAQGTYDWVTWPQKIHVSVGSTGALKLDSGIRLVGPGIGRNYYFSVLDASGRTVEEWQSNAFQLLPLGKYAIEARADGAQAWKRIADGAEVRPGSLTDINVPVLQK